MINFRAVTIAYYAANMQGLTWIKPVHDLTGGTLCTDREITAQQAREAFPDAAVRFFHPGTKWSVRGVRGADNMSSAQNDKDHNDKARRFKLERRPGHVSLAHIARELSPDVIVSTANLPHYIRRGGWAARRQGGTFPHVRQAQIFHGISSKNNKFQTFMANYDLLLLAGDRDRERFAQIGVLDKTRWCLVGLPRSDRVARGEINRDATLRELGLPDRPTVLYAPTHGSLSSFFSWGQAVCEAVPETANLIIKPHPLIAQSVASGSASSATWDTVQTHVARREHARFLPRHADIQALMAAADVLVTDFSSAAEEFLAFNRPLVFANHLAAKGYYQTRGEWDEIHRCGQVVTQVNDLTAAITRALHEPQQYAAQREQMRDRVFYKVDGHAAERAAAALHELAAHARGEARLSTTSKVHEEPAP